MKKNLIKEMFSKTKEELKDLIKQEEEDIKKLFLYKSVKKPKNTREIFMKRKKVAQLKTILREKELING
ncbi:50S ribosomal protein L29 [Candidatus Microgenomates bacterium]|nr:50S ribosomal protein L29 [Candidatus Microgenomates bacterium]